MLCNEKKGAATDKADTFPEGERYSFYEKMPEVSYGGGRSPSRTRLNPRNSLLTGKLTGNYAEIARLMRF
jgi:hypothetical protein